MPITTISSFTISQTRIFTISFFSRSTLRISAFPSKGNFSRTSSSSRQQITLSKLRIAISAYNRCFEKFKKPKSSKSQTPSYTSSMIYSLLTIPWTLSRRLAQSSFRHWAQSNRRSLMNHRPNKSNRRSSLRNSSLLWSSSFLIHPIS
jgi:hypothetical protein